MKNHKKIGSEVQLKGFNPDKQAVTRGFILSLKGLGNIPYQDVTQKKKAAAPGAQTNAANKGPTQQPIQGVNYFVEYYITLYNQEQKIFYGRTYRTNIKRLEIKGGTWECNGEEWAFLHTNYVVPQSVAVVECVLVADQGGRQKYGSLGFATLDIFSATASNISRADLFTGSPRDIFTIQQSGTVARGANTPNVTFQCSPFSFYDSIKALIPQNCFVGKDDLVPGLRGDKLPAYQQYLQGGN